MSCKHKALKSTAPKRKFCGSASNTKADSETKGLLETAIQVAPRAISINFAWLWWSPTWSKFQNFSRGARPQIPLQYAVCCTRTDNCALRVLHQPPFYMYAPPPRPRHWHLAIPLSSNDHFEGHQWHDPHKCFVEMLGVLLKK